MNDIIKFGMHLTGHSEADIKQMYNDWQQREDEGVTSVHKTYEINFDANVLCKLKVADNKIEVEAAMDGYGNAIKISDIIVKALGEPMAQKEDQDIEKLAEDWRAKIKEDFPLDFKHLTNWIEANCGVEFHIHKSIPTQATTPEDVEKLSEEKAIVNNWDDYCEAAADI